MAALNREKGLMMFRWIRFVAVHSVGLRYTRRLGIGRGAQGSSPCSLLSGVLESRDHGIVHGGVRLNHERRPL